MTEESTKERELLKEALSASGECASLVQLERLAEPDARLWEHIASCPRCQTEWTMLNTFEATTPLPEEARDVRWISRRLARQFEAVPTARSPWWQRLGSLGRIQSAGFAMAALAVMVAVGLGLHDSNGPAVVAPTRGEALAMRSLEVRALGPAGDLE